jgi:hypothetical protein
MGIEPTSEAWEASILPLYDARSASKRNDYIILRNRPKLLLVTTQIVQAEAARSTQKEEPRINKG